MAARTAALRLDGALRAGVLTPLEEGAPADLALASYLAIVRTQTEGSADPPRLELSRTALRVRNPENAADDWERAKLEIFRFSMDGGVDPATLEISEIVKETNGQTVFRWIKPIAMEESCLTCHGDAIDPKLLDLIEQDYPVDEATGYYASEMGGAYSVRLPLD
jgi:hypothetical protein